VSAATFKVLRELTVNGLDAIAMLGDHTLGRVVWDTDWLRFDASGGRVRKLPVTDTGTGTGMTPGQLRRYINQLASSSRDQSAAANFGVEWSKRRWVNHDVRIGRVADPRPHPA
jgi:hypothetical protein